MSPVVSQAIVSFSVPQAAHMPIACHDVAAGGAESARQQRVLPEHFLLLKLNTGERNETHGAPGFGFAIA